MQLSKLFCLSSDQEAIIKREQKSHREQRKFFFSGAQRIPGFFSVNRSKKNRLLCGLARQGSWNIDVKEVTNCWLKATATGLHLDFLWWRYVDTLNNWTRIRGLLVLWWPAIKFRIVWCLLLNLFLCRSNLFWFSRWFGLSSWSSITQVWREIRG